MEHTGGRTHGLKSPAWNSANDYLCSYTGAIRNHKDFALRSKRCLMLDLFGHLCCPQSEEDQPTLTGGHLTQVTLLLQKSKEKSYAYL